MKFNGIKYHKHTFLSSVFIHLHWQVDRLLHIVFLFSKEDVDIIVDELSEVKITEEAKQIIFENTNRFRQLIKDISLLENLAKTNGLNKIDVKQVKGLKIGQ